MKTTTTESPRLPRAATCALVAAAVFSFLTGCTPTYHTVDEGTPLSSVVAPAQPQAAEPVSESPAEPASRQTQDPTRQGEIGMEEAKALALAYAGAAQDQASFTKSELDWEEGRQVYELEFSLPGGERWEYDVDAATGEILKAGWETKPSGQPGRGVTAEEAKALALAKVPGAESSDMRSFETDEDHGRVEYEGEIAYDGGKYEFEIDGTTGEILSWEYEKQ